MRRLLNLLVIASLLLSFGAAALWVRSRSTWETLYLRTGGWLWRFDSALSTLNIEHFRDWPNPPSHHYRASEPDPYKSVTPVFAFRYAGANRTEWERGPFAGAYGTVCVVLRPDGSVDWDSPAFPILNSLRSAKFSPPFPFWSMTLPHWFLVLVFALPPVGRAVAIVCRHAVRRRRRARGLCASCSYDVRESPARCPECGAAAGVRSGGAVEA
jgi:hypothetical protein